MDEYRVTFVPTALVIESNKTAILTESIEIKDRLQEVLSEC